MPSKTIVRKLGHSRKAVKRTLAVEHPLKHERPAKGSLVDAVEPRIRERLVVWPTMSATVFAKRVGWIHSPAVPKDRVRELRPLSSPPKSASRTAFEPGGLAQSVFWFPPVDVPLGSSWPVTGTAFG